jgi:CubicO group peptidase (beta-lactamase class C family)
MKILFLLLLVAIAPAWAGQKNEKIDGLFAAYDHDNVPGAAVAVFHDGKIAYHKAYGLADVEAEIPTTTATNYRLASVTKQFTAMAVLQLIEAGKLSFEDTLTKIFPDFPGYGDAITVRHLLNHTSGLKDYEDLIPGSVAGQLHDADILDIYRNQSSAASSAGSRYRYCNGGYVLLGLIVAQRSGETFAGYLKKHLFEAIGMKNTVAFEAGISSVASRAYGYTRSGGGFRRTDQSTTSATLGDGGVYTSVDEMFLWDQALYEGKLVSTSLLQQAFTPGKLDDGSSTHYGMGWMLGTYHGEQRVYHTGSSIGFRTAIARFPSRKLTVVVLVNRANVVPWETVDRIAAMYLD